MTVWVPKPRVGLMTKTLARVVPPENISYIRGHVCGSKTDPRRRRPWMAHPPLDTKTPCLAYLLPLQTSRSGPDAFDPELFTFIALKGDCDRSTIYWPEVVPHNGNPPTTYLLVKLDRRTPMCRDFEEEEKNHNQKNHRVVNDDILHFRKLFPKKIKTREGPRAHQ